ncbi:hypothetical protein [Streptomyces himalayensis]|uniref:Acyl-protein synthetase LuxE domain-containing protein n=1 Tax=Streptomyces himalayensis subsp. himalayensis TaxID=2756131 RepID=A0A7W0I7U6_9ACTN|nr:hypothetical protein [Streptomyces himalayensis]MBA2945695.1 hypothetical protein [Streptomyces himalayensis subsp. himalayensis]
MASAREQIRALVVSGDTFDKPAKEVRELQLEAAREAFHSHRERIPLLRTRAEETGVHEITGPEDLVPMLFSHTSYKSYPVSLIAGGRWDRLLRWYSTVSVVEADDVDVDGVRDIDEWTERITAAGHRPYITSGTSGKVSFLNCDASDLKFLHDILEHLTCWPDPLPPKPTRRGYLLAPASGPMRSIDGFRWHAEVFARPGETQLLTEDTLRVSELMSSALLRRRMAEGTATPQEISAFETASEAREEELGAAVTRIVDDIVAHRDEPLLIAGMNNQQFTVIQALRARGIPDGGLHPDTLVLSGGGNKGRALPDDYQQQFAAFYQGVRRVRSYGMTELQGSCPACEKGKYHVPPWVIPLVLDRKGETLLNAEQGVVEGRFAFLDVSLEGRWGGLITGDRVRLDFSSCDCGRSGPVILPDIQRYGDLGGDDKITCAATLDSYVRGMIHG